MKYVLAIAAVLFASQQALAAQPDDTGAPATAQTVAYAYGMNLDVAKVISLHAEPADACASAPATLTYQDHRGDVHSVTYQKLPSQCGID